MNTRKTMNMWSFGLMLVLLCIWSVPRLAGAGTVPPIPTGPFDANGNPSVPDYYTTANWANSPPLAKFVDSLPGLGSAKANNLGQYLSVAKPDITTYPGSDYYEIDLVEYKQQLHSNLPAAGTLLRGYVQVNRGTNISAGTLPSQNLCGADQHACTPADTAAGTGLLPDPVRYLGPTIVSERDRPVRIKFTNRLPSGPAGDLFIPVDTSVMGAGSGPASLGTARGDGGPCDNTVEPNQCANYTQNRADIHLHGGRTPWISDGTPHQWITPVDEITPFTKGVSFRNVPDMPDPGDGSMTYYYTNQQSARLMFYHDHAWGITRLGVYVGGAAGYLITDQWEQDLANRGIIPPDQIPLIIQDKTFVDATPVTHPVSGAITPQIRVTDPLWNWGSAAPDATGVRPPVTGDLWLPHVYMPAQTLAAGFGGVNPFGRWMYGPWFYPATAVTKGPVANPYYDADCSSPFPAVYANCTTPGQPTMIPGTPHPSMGMEAFQDSVVVNGTAFPSLTVDPRAYRFRILNGASDRFWNLSFYKADPAQPSLVNGSLTEVKMVPAAVTPGWPALWPTDARDGGVPDPGALDAATGRYSNWGPSFLQIGNESGFLPKPVTIEPQPITYITDPTAFWVGVVDKMGLALGPAERADVIVDFSAYAGQTLILYNDAPAAWPARVAGYDYYTGAPDMRDSGGYGAGGVYDPATGVWVPDPNNAANVPHGPLPGYAPNTRTVMQVIVRPAAGTDPAYTFNQAALEAEFTSAAPATAINPIITGSNPPRAMTLFERAQEPIIVGQAAYSSAYPNSYFPPNYPWEGINQINDHFLQFVTVAGQPVSIPTEPKGIHDEMGASFDPIYGRMSGNLAMQLPNPTTLNALLVLYGFSDLPTETINNSPTVNVQVLGSGTDPLPWKVTDGTQIWKISHNGVDTHPIHFHIFDVQLINRVGWDGQTLLPEPNELGWKEVVKISPLMDTIVAVRPRAPALPFGVPNSVRPLNPAIPIDSPMGFNSVDWQTGQARIPAVTNQLYNFNWEYVWHCHILSHEEMDMMRPIALNVESILPDAPVLSSTMPSSTQVDFSWTDTTPVDYVTRAGFGDPKNEIGFLIERATGAGPFVQIGTALANATTFSDPAILQNMIYQYRVIAYNAAGNAVSNIISIVTAPPPAITTTTLPDGIIAVAYSQTLAATGGLAPLTWSVSAGALPTPLTLNPATGVISGTPDTIGTFNFTVMVTDAAARTATQALSITVLPPPIAAPANLTAAITSATQIRLTWTDASNNETSFVVWRSVNGAPAVPVGTVTRNPAQTAATGGTVTFNNNGVTAGSTYAYYVTAINGTGTSAASNTVTVAFTVPANPSNLTGSAARITGNNRQDLATLNWTDNSNNETGFTIQRSLLNSFPNLLTTTYTVGANVTTFSQNVTRLVNYYYRVRASNLVGNSGWSNVILVNTP